MFWRKYINYIKVLIFSRKKCFQEKFELLDSGVPILTTAAPKRHSMLSTKSSITSMTEEELGQGFIGVNEGLQKKTKPEVSAEQQSKLRIINLVKSGRGI